MDSRSSFIARSTNHSMFMEGHGGMAKFEWNGTEFILTEKMGIKAGDFRKIKDVVDENADIIINRWNEYFNK